MFQLIEKLRQKSEGTKKQIAFLIAFTLAGVIFVIWHSVIYPDFRDNQNLAEKAVKTEVSPLSNFNNNISSYN